MTESTIATKCRIQTLFAIACFMSAPWALGVDWYVDNRAGGSNDGTSWANAWDSFGSINWNSVDPGDTVYISGGGPGGKTYNETLAINAAGASGSPIEIRVGQVPAHRGVVTITDGVEFRYNPHYTILNGEYNGARHIRITNPDHVGIDIYGVHDILITHVEVYNCGDETDDHGIRINWKVDDIEIADSWIHDVYQDCINIRNAELVPEGYEHYIIRDCLLEGAGDDGVQCGPGSLTVRDCRIFGSQNWAPGAHPDGVQLNPHKYYARVHGNTIRNFSQNIFIEQPRGHIEVYNNISYKEPSITTGSYRGISLSPSTQYPFEGHAIVANNIFSGFTTYIGAQIGHFQGGFEPADDLVIANNIFLDNKVHFSGNGERLNPSNLFYKRPGVQCYDNNGSPVGTCGAGIPDGFFPSDPKLTDPAGYDFRQAADSPAVDAGVDMAVHFITDIDGEARPMGFGWDIGPYEQSGASVPKAPSNPRFN